MWKQGRDKQNCFFSNDWYDGENEGSRPTAFSILLFTEASTPSGFFLKKKSPCTI